MKKLFPLIYLFLAANLHAQSDTCHPTFKEIYDFNVGDVLMYRSYSSYECYTGIGVCNDEEYTKVLITGKDIYNDSQTVYHRYKHTIRYYEFYKSETTSDYKGYYDTYNHVLNQCNNDTLASNEKYPLELLIIKTNEDTKTLINKGGVGICEEKYKKGLGMIYRRFQTEWLEGMELIGYIKNGDTTGIVWSDTKFSTKNEFLPNIEIFPNPAHSNFTIELPMEYEAFQVELISADGSVVLSQKFVNSGQNVISTGNIAPGFYVVRVYAEKDVFFKKLIIN